MSSAQTIYVTLDLRRALWVSETTGAKIVCAYRSDMLNWMREQGADIWCFEEEFPEAEIPKSTFLLLSRALTLNMLRDIGKPLEFIVFKPSNKIKRWVEEQAWTLLAADVQTCRTLEDKIDFATLATEQGLKVPEHEVLLWDGSTREAHHAKYGPKLVVQGRMGHAGSSTYIFEQGQEAPQLAQGTRVKVNRFVEGPTYTLNGHMDGSGKAFFGPLWRQIMHVSAWNHYEMGTVGVSPALELAEKNLESLSKELEKLSKLLKNQQYKGFFGIDVILDGAGTWWVIEVNPRLTATVSLQCLEDLSSTRPSLLAPAVSEQEEALRAADFGQLIFRNGLKRVWKTPKTLKSGIYSQENGVWKLKARAYDARELGENEVLLLLSRAPGTSIDPGSDYASLQFRGSAFEGEALKDLFFDFYERVVQGYLIRPKDFCEDRFVELAEDAWLLRKPVDTEKASLRQTEVGQAEVMKLLGEHEAFWLAEKADGTRGWLKQQENASEASFEGFEMPGKASKTAEIFLKHWVGTPYCWGGNSEQGIDCSAFVQRYFWEVKGIALPKHSQDQKAFCQQDIEPSELQNDDLVFAHSKEKGIAHVGLWQDGSIWHSSLETGVVKQKLQTFEKRYEIEALKRL